MSPGSEEDNSFAIRLFSEIVEPYDRWAQLLSLGRYLSWRRDLVARLCGTDGRLVLDVSTGRAGIAIEIARRCGYDVVGLDLTRAMLLAGLNDVAGAGLNPRVSLVQGRAECLPFKEGTFDVVVFSFLLRYVSDPQAVVREMARVLKPRGRMMSLEFGVPPGAPLRALWTAHTRLVMPAIASPLSQGWRRVAAFLGPSISRFYRRFPVSLLEDIWMDAGMREVQTYRLSLGAAVIMSGIKGDA